jgi:subtilisin family serine protease
VLAVGATDAYDQRWYYSMYGPELDVVAPSSDLWFYGDIWTLDRTSVNGYNPTLITCNPQNTNYDCHFGGTSTACPEVAGIIALVMLRQPNLIGQTAAIRSLIEASADDQVGEDGYDPPGRDNHYGWGRVNAARALMMSCTYCGDANNDGSFDISDAVFLISYIFSGGPAPGDCSYSTGLGDANGDGDVDLSDAVYLIAYINSGGAAPHCL